MVKIQGFVQSRLNDKINKLTSAAETGYNLDSDRLGIILGTTSALISSIGSHELLQVIADNAKEISNAKIVSLSFFDEEKGTVKLGALSGPEPSLLLRKVSEMLKIENLFRHEFPISKCPSFQEFLKKKERKPVILSSFHEYTFGLFDKRICSLIEKIMGFKEIVAIPLVKNEKLEGILGYLFPTKEKRDFTPLLIFADLVSQALEKSKMFEERLRREKVAIMSEYLAGDIIREFGVRIPVGELGSREILGQLADLATKPPPRNLFNLLVIGTQIALSREGVEVSEVKIREFLAPIIKRSLQEIFGMARKFNRDIPSEYKELEKELANFEVPTTKAGENATNILKKLYRASNTIRHF